MATVMVPAELADAIVEELGVTALEEYHNALMVNLTAAEDLYEDITSFFAMNPRAPRAFYAPIWNSSAEYH